MHEFKVKFYLRPDSGQAQGLRTVQARIYLDHQRDYLTSTKVTVPEKVWNAKQEKVMLKTPEGHLLNHRLEKLRKQITDIYHQHETDVHLSLDIIKKAYYDIKAISGDSGVCSFFLRYIRDNKDILGKDTHRRLLQVANLFTKYIAYAYNTKDIGFEDIDYRMLKEFLSYLRVKEGYVNDRTLMNKVYTFKTLLGAAHELGMVEEISFEGLMTRDLSPLQVVYLTVGEIKILKRLLLGKRLDRVRDCFLFSCFTGLSYPELRILSKDNLILLNGSTWIMLEGGAECEPRYIPLLPYPASILRKYSNSEEQASLLPLISQQKMNQYLKEIGVACGFGKLLTFQTAVQSFIKNALSSGATTDSVSHMVGKTLREVGTYARFSPERVEEEMSLFASKMGS